MIINTNTFNSIVNKCKQKSKKTENTLKLLNFLKDKTFFLSSYSCGSQQGTQILDPKTKKLIGNFVLYKSIYCSACGSSACPLLRDNYFVFQVDDTDFGPYNPFFLDEEPKNLRRLGQENNRSISLKIIANLKELL